MKLTRSALIGAAALWLGLSAAAVRVAWVQGQADALTLTREDGPCHKDRSLSCLKKILHEPRR